MAKRKVKSSVIGDNVVPEVAKKRNIEKANLAVKEVKEEPEKKTIELRHSNYCDSCPYLSRTGSLVASSFKCSLYKREFVFSSVINFNSDGKGGITRPEECKRDNKVIAVMK